MFCFPEEIYEEIVREVANQNGENAGVTSRTSPAAGPTMPNKEVANLELIEFRIRKCHRVILVDGEVDDDVTLSKAHFWCFSLTLATSNTSRT